VSREADGFLFSNEYICLLETCMHMHERVYLSINTYTYINVQYYQNDLRFLMKSTQAKYLFCL